MRSTTSGRKLRRAVFSSLITGACGLLLPTTPHAADGKIEINQAKALAGGVTATDAPGFPVTIDQSGSYLLTSDLTVPADTSACRSPSD